MNNNNNHPLDKLKLAQNLNKRKSLRLLKDFNINLENENGETHLQKQIHTHNKIRLSKDTG